MDYWCHSRKRRIFVGQTWPRHQNWQDCRPQIHGKGGYSWVKRGQDIKTGKIVALKFMEKADVSWVKEQAKQVETEIEALKNIRHQNVMKLYAYNLNSQYPLSPDSPIA